MAMGGAVTLSFSDLSTLAAAFGISKPVPEVVQLWCSACKSCSGVVSEWLVPESQCSVNSRMDAF